MLLGLSAAELSSLTGVSTVLGLLGMLAGLFYNLQVKEVDKSVRSQLIGQPLLNRPETWQLLNDIKDPTIRIDKLKELHGIDEATARIVLKSVGRIDANRTQEKSLEHQRATAFIAGGFFIAIAVLAIFDKSHHPPDIAATTPGAAESLPAPLPPGPGPKPVQIPVKPVAPVHKATAPYEKFYLKAKTYLDAKRIPDALKECAKAEADPGYGDNKTCQQVQIAKERDFQSQ